MWLIFTSTSLAVTVGIGVYRLQSDQPAWLFFAGAALLLVSAIGEVIRDADNR